MEISCNNNLPSRGNDSVWQVEACMFGSDTVAAEGVEVEEVNVGTISVALSVSLM